MVSSTTTTKPLIAYPVQRGDTLTSIGGFFGVAPTVLAAFNHLANGDKLTVGQVLKIPRHVPLQLVAKPAHAPAGEAFELMLTGAQPDETVTFEIDAPGGHKFTGPSHTAASDGSVTAEYQTSQTDAAGTYTVSATGNHGTSALVTFRVDPTSPST